MATVKCARGKRGSPSHEMDEYIKRGAVIDLITRRYENPEICTQEINSIPAADVAPVVHGRWINAYPDIEPNPLFMYGICSNCGLEQGLSDKLNYCPNCGAKMDGGSE